MHDDANAFLWTEKAAEADNASSADMARLADFFAKGRGVAQDYAKAFHWNLVATMPERRDFKGCPRKPLPIFVSGAEHAFQASFERPTPHSPSTASSDELA